MNRIGYIVVQHFHYDSTEPIENPIRIYDDEDEAREVAESITRGMSTGLVWQVSVPVLP